MAKLVATGLKKEFLRNGRGTNIFTAVEACDFTLRSGLTMLTGRSGSGKSTLLSMLSGLLTPTAGTVSFNGTDLYSLSDEELSRLRNEHFGFVPQGQSAVGSLTVRENIELPCTLFKKDDGARERADALMQRMGIFDLRDAMPNELSGGELRRMAIARALIREPEILFADEPTGDLDDENTTLVLQLLRETADRGAAVFLVTHEDDAASYADQSYRMADGGIKRDRNREQDAGKR